MSDYWAKIYIEILDDPKMATMPDRVWRRTIELFLVAKRLNKEGHLPDTRQIAWLLRMPADELEHDMRQIASTGIVVQEVGGWFIPKFAERQAATPAKQRMAEMRRREQQEQYYGSDNESVTNPLRNVTQSTENRNREQSTETETEKNARAGASTFEATQHLLESVLHVSPSGENDINAIIKISKMDATVEDVQAALRWVTSKTGKTVRYYSSLVNPIQLEVARRMQAASMPKKEIFVRQTEVE